MIPSRERQAFDTFVAESSDPLLRTAYLLCGDRGHAEDLVQTALLRTARHWRSARRQPRAYARAIVVNLAKDHWRSRSRRPAEVPLPPTLDVAHDADVTSGLLDRHDLVAAFQRLAEGQRAVLVLRYFDDLSVEETAEVLGCTAGTVKSQTSRALAAIRSILSDPKPPTREISHAHR